MNIIKFTKISIKQIAKIFLGITVIGFLFYYLGFEENIRTLSRLRGEYVLMALTIHLTSWIWRSYRTKAIFSDQKITNITKYQIAKINFAGYALNMFLPLKLGDIGQMYLFHTQTKIPMKASITSVIYTRIFDIITLALIGIVSLLLILNSNPNQNISVYIIIFIAIISLAIAGTSTTIQTKVAKLVSKKRPHLAEIIESFRLSRKCRVQSIIYSVFVWIPDGICVYLILKGLNQDIPLTIAFLGLVVANMMKSIPTTPGGFGLFEGSMALLFISFGVNQNIAIVAATVDHFIKNIYVLVFGVPQLMRYNYDKSMIQVLKAFQKNKAKTFSE